MFCILSVEKVILIETKCFYNPILHQINNFSILFDFFFNLWTFDCEKKKLILNFEALNKVNGSLKFAVSIIFYISMNFEKKDDKISFKTVLVIFTQFRKIEQKTA